MAGETSIEWATHSWNPIVGCSVVSPGCTNCYAMRMAARIEKMQDSAQDATYARKYSPYGGLTQNTKAGPVWNGKVALASDDALTKPLHWKEPREIFVNSMGDLFHESVPDAWIDRVFAVMALAPQHTFIVLTKRARRMQEYLTRPHRPGQFITIDDDGRQTDTPRANIMAFSEMTRLFAKTPPAQLNLAAKLQEPHGDGFMPRWPLPNVYLGVSVEDPPRADERREDLAALAAQGWSTFVSYEPALGPVDWRGWEFLKGIISGGESGPGARPGHPDWHRGARDFCASRGIAYFFKQWGAFEVIYDRDKDDPDWVRADLIARDPYPSRWLNLAGGQGFHGERVVRVKPASKARAGRLLDGREHNDLPWRVA